MRNWDCCGGPLPSPTPLTSSSPRPGCILATAPPMPLKPPAATQPPAADAALSVCVGVLVYLCMCNNIYPHNNMLQESFSFLCAQICFSGLLNLAYLLTIFCTESIFKNFLRLWSFSLPKQDLSAFSATLLLWTVLTMDC